MEGMQGRLWEGILPGVLRDLYIGRRTGLLSVGRDKERRSVRPRNGSILSADTNVREDHMGELAARLGLVSPADVKRAVGCATRSGSAWCCWSWAFSI